MTEHQIEQFERLQERLLRLTLALERSANQQLVLADRVEKHSSAMHRHSDTLLEIRRNLTTVAEQRELTLHAVNHTNEQLRLINEKLGLVSRDLDDVEDAIKDVTGQHRLIEAKPEKKPLIVHVLELLLAAPLRAQILIAVLVVAAVLSGWGVTIVHWIKEIK